MEARRPLGGSALRPVGKALINPDCTITAWLDALPTTGTLVLRADPHAAPLRLGSGGDDAAVTAEHEAASPLH